MWMSSSGSGKEGGSKIEAFPNLKQSSSSLFFFLYFLKIEFIVFIQGPLLESFVAGLSFIAWIN